MFLPIGDSPNFRATPWVTYGLIAVNVLVYLLMLPLGWQQVSAADPGVRAYVEVLRQERGVAVSAVSVYDAVVFRYGFKPRWPALSDMLTAMFLHGGLLHLVGNMLFLWIYGDNVEHRLGRVGFLLAYLAAGLAGTLGDALLRAGSAIPSVGASGAISGVLGFYFVWFPRNRVRVWIFLFPIFFDIVELPARIVLGIYLVVDNLLPALLGAGSGVAGGAHLGGFAAAAALALGFDRFHLARPEGELRARPTPTASAAGVPRDALRTALAQGDLGGGLAVLMAASDPRQPPVDPVDALVLAERLAAAGHPRAALAVNQRVLADHPRGAVAARAHLLLAEVLVAAFSLPTEAAQHLVRGLEAGADAAAAARLRELLAELARSGVVPRRWLH